MQAFIRRAGLLENNLYCYDTRFKASDLTVLIPVMLLGSDAGIIFFFFYVYFFGDVFALAK